MLDVKLLQPEDWTNLQNQLEAMQGRITALEEDVHLLMLGVGSGGSGFQETLLTDFDTRTEPALPTLTDAGDTVTDPTFGTTILKVTDGTNAPYETGAGIGAFDGVVSPYSYQPCLNKDNTWIFGLVVDGFTKARFWEFDPVNFTVDTGSGVFLSDGGSGGQQYGIIWSRTDPNKLYLPGNYNLYEIDISGGPGSASVTTLKSFSGLGHTGGYITQIFGDDSDNIFCGRFEGGTGNGYWVWNRNTDTVLLDEVSGVNIDECMVDKSGRYFIVVMNDGSDEVWDLQGGPTQIADTTDLNQGNGLGFWHRECGSNLILTAGGTNNLVSRTGANPTSTTACLNNGDWSYSSQQDHFSMRADNNLWLLAGRYHTSGGSVADAFDNEILQIATDGSKRVRRICHHRSVFNEYYDAPFANISQDGKFVCFSSNWGDADGRHDLYVVQIQAAPLS